MRNFWLDPKDRQLRHEVADGLGVEGLRPGGALRGSRRPVGDRRSDLQRVKLRLHRFFVNLPQHPL